MKISDIECWPVQAPGRTLVIILVHTDEGLVGVGEAGLQRRPKAICGLVEHLRRWLIGEDPMRTEHLWQRMWRGGFYPGDRLVGSVVSGIDIALWDLKGQALGVPVYQLLGGRCRDYVSCFLNTSYSPDSGALAADDAVRLTEQGDPDAAVELARRCLAEGHEYFRLAPPHVGNLFDPRTSAKQLVKQLEAVREAVGDRLELMVDLHTRLDPPEAVWFCRAVEPLDLFVVEDPIRAERPAGYRAIRARTHVPLAAGEQWAGKWEFLEAIEGELIDYARVDLCISGGFTEALKIAGSAEAHNIKMLLHNPLGPVCTAASLHFDLACSNAGPQEVQFPPKTLLPDVFEIAFELEGCRLSIPTAPGIGVRFNREAAARYPAEWTEPPHFHRPDGAFTNY